MTSACIDEAKKTTDHVVHALVSFLPRPVAGLVGEYVHDPVDVARSRNNHSWTQDGRVAIVMYCTVDVIQHIVDTLVPDGCDKPLSHYVRMSVVQYDDENEAYLQKVRHARSQAVSDGYTHGQDNSGYSCTSLLKESVIYFAARPVAASLGILLVDPFASCGSIQFSLADKTYWLMARRDAEHANNVNALLVIRESFSHSIWLDALPDKDPWQLDGPFWLHDDKLWEKRKRQLLKPLSFADLLLCMGLHPRSLHPSWRRALTFGESKCNK